MATKRKTTKKTSPRRRRRSIGFVGAGAKSIIMQSLGVFAGYYIANNLLPKLTEKLPVPAGFQGVVPVAVGTLLLPRVYKGGMSNSISMGINLAGLVKLAQDNNILQGAGDYVPQALIRQLPSEIAGFEAANSTVGEIDVIQGIDELQGSDFI